MMLARSPAETLRPTALVLAFCEKLSSPTEALLWTDLRVPATQLAMFPRLVQAALFRVRTFLQSDDFGVNKLLL